MSDWKGRLTQYQSFMESYLAGRFLNEGEPQQKLFEAMRYSLLAGGKRLRLPAGGQIQCRNHQSYQRSSQWRLPGSVRPAGEPVRSR